MPALAHTVALALEGRVGMVRAVFLEVTGRTPDADEAVELVLMNAVADLSAYLAEQMAAGRLRPLYPLLALQAFIGPIVFHLLTRELVQERLGLELTVEDAVAELAAGWLRSMRRNAA